jgi:hypothetical protein
MAEKKNNGKLASAEDSKFTKLILNVDGASNFELWRKNNSNAMVQLHGPKSNFLETLVAYRRGVLMMHHYAPAAPSAPAANAAAVEGDDLEVAPAINSAGLKELQTDAQKTLNRLMAHDRRFSLH